MRTVVNLLDKLGVPDMVVKPLDQFYWIAIAVCVVGLLWAVWQTKREGGSMAE